MDLAAFTAKVIDCLNQARQMYGHIGNVEIKYDLRGRAAAQAQRRYNRLILRFNVEAIEKSYDDMVNETIPHEVAHIVAFAFPNLGAKNHNHGWKRIARSLGSNADRCHTIQLTPARRRQRAARQIYRLDSGREILVGPTQHKRIQQGAKYNVKMTGESIEAHYYVGPVS